MSFTVIFTFSLWGFDSSSTSTSFIFLSWNKVLMNKLCLEIGIFLFSWEFFNVILSRVSHICVKIKKSLVIFWDSWNCISIFVQGWEVSMATSFVSFFATIACLKIELRIFHPFSDWGFGSWIKKYYWDYFSKLFCFG